MEDDFCGLNHSKQERRTAWTASEEEFLCNNYRRIPVPTLAKTLQGRTASAIWNKAEKMRLTRQWWTLEEIQFLEDNYEGLTAAQIGAIIGRPCRGIEAKAQKLGVKAPREGLKGERSPRWKGGTSTNVEGYEVVSSGPNRHRGVHRVVMEEHLGRSLSPKEAVHHVNGNKRDNCIENLKIMTFNEHTILHKLKRGANA